MSSERSLWNLTREKLGPFGRLTRIENRCDRGTPDVAYTLRRPATIVHTSGWLELKYLSSWPVKPSTPIRVESLTFEQVTWLIEEEKAGGRAWCLLQIERTYLLLAPWVVQKLYDGVVDGEHLLLIATVQGHGRLPIAKILSELTR